MFIEDTSIVIEDRALVTNMGALQRRPEVKRVNGYLKSLEEIKTHVMPSHDMTVTIDGGDVLFTGKEIFVGLTDRTNHLGVKFLQKAFPKYDVHEIDMSRFHNILRLKSACSMCFEMGIMVGGEVGMYIREIIEKKSTTSEGYKFFQIPDMVAANGLLVNDTLIRRHNEEFPNSIQAFEEVDEFVTSHDGIVVPIKADELAKVDGALTCCCLLMDI